MSDFKKTTYSDHVADHIKKLILNGTLLPGAPVREVAIASELSISRAPIREAMQLLVKEGLIVSHPQKGKKITALTSHEIRNSYFTGAVLEAAAVANARGYYTEEDFARLEDIVAQMKSVADTDRSVERQAPLDNAFHDILFSRVDNDLLVELCRRSCQGISKFLLFRHWVKLFSAQKVYERHREILDAMKTKNPKLIEHVIREHYMESGRRMSAFGVDVYDESQDA